MWTTTATACSTILTTPGVETSRGDLEDPECDDGIDNDSDTLIDFPADSRCIASWGTSEGSGLEPYVVGAWGFEESVGTLVADASGNGNDGVLANGAARSANGYFGNALKPTARPAMWISEGSTSRAARSR